MACGAYLKRAVSPNEGGTPEALQERWGVMNEWNGIFCFGELGDFFNALDRKTAPGDYRAGLVGRRQLLAWIQRCVDAGALEELRESLR
jgi:hypothetical protein